MTDQRNRFRKVKTIAVLFDATIEAFAADPNARVVDIGSRCGTRKSMIHYYFPGGIEDLRREAWHHYAQRSKTTARNLRYELATMAHAMTRPDLATLVVQFIDAQTENLADYAHTLKGASP